MVCFCQRYVYLSIHTVTPNKLWGFSKNCPVGKSELQCKPRYERLEIGTNFETNMEREWNAAKYNNRNMLFYLLYFCISR